MLIGAVFGNRRGHLVIIAENSCHVRSTARSLDQIQRGMCVEGPEYTLRVQSFICYNLSFTIIVFSYVKKQNLSFDNVLLSNVELIQSYQIIYDGWNGSEHKTRQKLVLCF